MRVTSLPPLAGAALAPLLLSACALGPAYALPQTHVTDRWLGEAGTGAVQAERWWEQLHDPMLNGLVEQMLAGNPDLREAQARVAEARANRDAVRGGRLPQVTTSASGNQVVLSENGQMPVGQIPGFARDFPLFDVGFDASWELDLWGRQARQSEAAQARSEAAALSAQAVRMQLIAELARAYVGLRQAQADLAVAQDMLAARTQLADLAGLLERAGEANAIDAGRARGEAETARLAVTQAQAGVRSAAVQVARLVGKEPAALVPQLEQPGAIPAPPPAIAAGLPSELLRRRPDILGAERELAAATADIGAARADLFPRLSLSLAVGQQARAIGDLVSGDSTRLQGGGGLFWPLFNGGRARAMVRAADARAQAAAARYDGAVVGALADSEDAINRFDRSVEGLTAARETLAREEAAYALVSRRQAAGEDDRLALARAALARQSAMQQLNRAQAGAVQAAIALHKALGGDWSSESQASVEPLGAR
ncbi:efflux transporter outer membrane subunit [Sphingobium sp. B11D3A]|uniref:efflux transporter outer membrane subunit n=1 Tax=Sphingobium sp. B11D3A TaxID=2940574 RepID=UPI002223FEEC|nr:efflux transporter outer membrane subunit [Sphingobium sp. B11D3A]MCW2392460.1 NodT family efflux transporter outer membrane factor (OMF) lipoprotein [Sphingobium sp. B11D3A]